MTLSRSLLLLQSRTLEIKDATFFVEENRVLICGRNLSNKWRENRCWWVNFLVGFSQTANVSQMLFGGGNSSMGMADGILKRIFSRSEGPQKQKSSHMACEELVSLLAPRRSSFWDLAHRLIVFIFFIISALPLYYGSNKLGCSTRQSRGLFMCPLSLLHALSYVFVLAACPAELTLCQRWKTNSSKFRTRKET